MTHKHTITVEPGYYIESFAGRAIRHPMSDLDALNRDLDEIEARAASRPTAKRRAPLTGAEMSALSFRAQAGDAEAKAELRRRAHRMK